MNKKGNNQGTKSFEISTPSYTDQKKKVVKWNNGSYFKTGDRGSENLHRSVEIRMKV